METTSSNVGKAGSCQGLPTDTNCYRKHKLLGLQMVQSVTFVEQKASRTRCNQKDLCNERLHAASTFTEVEQNSWLAFNENPEIPSS